MAWVNKTALRALLDELGARYSEMQEQWTWYGRAKFSDGQAFAYCDFTLGGENGIKNEAPLIGTKYVGTGSDVSDIARAAKEAVRTRFRKQILACSSALNWDRRLDGQKAAEHTDVIIEVTRTVSIATIRTTSRLFGSSDTHYLVRNGLITSLPRL